jgi:hypothetical protein
LKKRYLPLIELTILPIGASTIYSNLGDGNGGSLPVEGNQFWVSEFETGSTAMDLEDVIFNLEASTGTGTLTASIYTNSGNAPSTLVGTIGTISHSSLSVGSFSEKTVTPGTTILLAANTQYWIELTGTSPSTADALWEIGTTDAGTGVSTEFHDRVTSGSVDTTEANSTFTNSIPEMEVDLSTTLPEPATFGVVGLSLAGLGILRLRSRKASAAKL